MAWHISTSMSMSTSKSMSTYSLPSILSVSWLPLQADGDHPVALPLACHDKGVAAVDSVSFLTLLLQFCHCAICVIMQFTLSLWHCVLHTHPRPRLPRPGDRRAGLRSAVIGRPRIIAGGRHGRLGTLNVNHKSASALKSISVNQNQCESNAIKQCRRITARGQPFLPTPLVCLWSRAKSACKVILYLLAKPFPICLQSNLSACMIVPYLFAIHPVCKQNRSPSVMPTSCGQWTSASMINVNAEHLFHQRNPLR